MKKSKTVPTSVQKTPPPIPELARKKTVHDTFSVSENIEKRQEDIEKWSLDTLKSAISKRSNKHFVGEVGTFKGVITSHHESGYSVIENENAFTLVITDPRLKKATYRRTDLRVDDAHQVRYFIHQPKVQPAGVAEAMDDLKYVGPTWLDKQFNNPSPVVAPEILRNMDVLKRDRLAFLVSVEALKEGETPSASFIKDLRKLERNKFVEDIKERSKLGYLPSKHADQFSGTVSKETKLRGGTYIIVSNKKRFVVLQADKFLRKQKGKDVTLSKAKDKNGRMRIKAAPDNSKERGGR